MNYKFRLNKVIPGGAHTYSRGSDQFPYNAPDILKCGNGAYVWDNNDKKYLDYGMALRAVTLGYSNQRVNDAAIKQIIAGNNLTRPSLIELEAAELFVDTIPGADMVKFAKNGSNVTTAAVKIARAYTGRRYICIPRQQPFFSYDDWFIGVTPVNKGIPEQNISSTLVFDYNDIKTLEILYEKYPGQIAAVLLEPATSIIPCSGLCSKIDATSKCNTCPNKYNNFLHQVQNLCKKNGSILIFDEMITGFRWSLKGAGDFFGVTPDLMTFGKAMANGFSVSAVAGNRDLMKVGSIEDLNSERTFLLSSTHGAEMCGLGAFVETVNIYKEEDVCGHLWNYGKRLKDGLSSIAKNHSIEQFFEITGPDISLSISAKNAEYIESLAFRTLFMQEMIRNGVLMPWIAISTSHTNDELQLTFDAADKALAIYKKALNEGIDNYLVGPAVKPVFRKYN